MAIKLTQWTADRLEKLTSDQLKVVRTNADRHSDLAAMELCDAELARRKPPRKNTRALSQSSQHSPDAVVVGFHFVCSNEQGVVRNNNGTAWSGTWVVDKEHAERAAKIGSYIALHQTKAESSYLQGIIRDFRRSEREHSYTEGQETQTKFGIDFLFEFTDKPYEWIGDSSGEKGYAWGRLPK